MMGSFYEDHCTYLLPMLGWWIFSALLSSYNKFVMGEDYMNFPFPLLLTCMHFGLQFIFSWSLSSLFPETLGGTVVAKMSWTLWFCVGVPCGLVTCLDIGLSNLAMVYITLTFYTMVKSSSPIFVLASAHLFGIEQVTWPLILTVLVIAAGEFVVVVGEAHFHLLGFVLCALASVLSGIRWTLVQLKLQTMDPPLPSSVATMRVLSPSMFVSMLFFSMLLERPWQVAFAPAELTNATDWEVTEEPTMSPTTTLLDDYNDKDDEEIFSLNTTNTTSRFQDIDLTTPEGISLAIFLGFGGAVLAICMILCEFILIMNSNAFVLMIGGVLKEVITIFVGVIYFHNHLAWINFLGCLIVLLGVALYKLFRHEHALKRDQETTARAKPRIIYKPIAMELVPNDSVDTEEDGNEAAENRPYQKPQNKGAWNVVQIREVVASSNGEEPTAQTSQIA